MNKIKKSQITMFMIVGLVILIVFIIFILLLKSAKPDSNNIKNFLNELEAGTIKNHVTNCMIQTASSAVQKIGANGGAIYDYESGTIPFSEQTLGGTYLNYTYIDKKYFVLYGLKKNTLCHRIWYRPPDYPSPDKKLDMLNDIYNDDCLYGSFYSAYDGFYGQNFMNKLCYVVRDSSCEAFAKGAQEGLTIQRQIEDYVAKKLPNCVNFTAFSNKAEVSITEETGQSGPIVKTIIHDSEVLVFVKYPLKIVFKNQEPITKIIDYETNLKVRLGSVYNSLYNVLSKDSKDILFDLKNQFISSKYWKQEITFKKIENPCPLCDFPYKYDDIIEVRDTKSLINGRPFIFRVAIENRGPALDKIENVEIDLKHDSPNIEIPLTAKDPDDNNVTYYFLSYSFGRDQCAPSDPHAPLIPYTSAWCEDDDAVSRADGELLRQELLKMYVNKRDYGNHAVAVLVIDDSGLFDYQNFNIKIDDTGFNNANHPDCIFNCTAEGLEDCDSWCQIAANQCRSECLGGSFYTEFYSQSDQDQCKNCVGAILDSGKFEEHEPPCSVYYNKISCINHMPDCFWVRQNMSNVYREYCIEDVDLSSVLLPAYIITENY